MLLPSGVAFAQKSGSPLGASALERARNAWSQGEFETAEPAYIEALEKGGLPRDATLECYIKLGAVRGVLGKKDLALAAFRTAALLDAAFVVPPEAGKKTVVLADAAKAQQARVGVGPLKAEPSAPAEVDGAAAFAVNVLLDPAHAAVIARLALSVFDGSTGKTFRFDEPAQAPFVHFRVPPTIVLPGARLVLHIDALDVHDNVLAEGESRVSVRPGPVASTKPLEGFNSGTSFWSTPWPYVIGGVLLAGAAVGGYFIFRPPTEVAVGAAQVEPR
ncbi:hypothetical protein BH09MYX1_BH09MYX1_09940 [soil metagenome]